MKPFHQVLAVTLIATTTTYFVWFALTFWAYLTTQSVISTSIVAGLQLVAAASTSMWFGSIVDHHKKKNALLGSSVATLALFAIGLLYFLTQPASAFESITSLSFWIFAFILLLGSVSGNMYTIAVPTLIGIVVPEKERDKANGLYGTVTGVSFALTSVASGITLAFGGMSTVLAVAVAFTALSIILLFLIHDPEKGIVHTHEKKQKIDIRGTLSAIHAVPGLLALIIFTTFNNFLGGIFMALLDAYGLNLVSVEEWGFILGALSFGVIFAGAYISKKGLGKSPLSTLLKSNVVAWTMCIFFTIQPSIILLSAGMLLWMVLFPFMQAAEQTILQKVVPPQRLGRVIGFARGVEQAASPITAFLIGPITQLVFIPFMTTGEGVELIGDWFGTGAGRGIALVFILAGMVGLAVTLFAMNSKQYHKLENHYQKTPSETKNENTEQN